MAVWKVWMKCPFCGRYLNQKKGHFTPGKYPLVVRQLMGGRNSSGRPVCGQPVPLSDEEVIAQYSDFLNEILYFLDDMYARLEEGPDPAGKLPVQSKRSAPKKSVSRVISAEEALRAWERAEDEADKEAEEKRVKRAKKGGKKAKSTEKKKSGAVTSPNVSALEVVEAVIGTPIPVETVFQSRGKTRVGRVNTAGPVQLDFPKGRKK